MPAEASISKADATIGYGASVHLEGESLDDCVAAGAGARRGDRACISSIRSTTRRSWPGQGTLGLELLQDVDDLAMVIVPLGGGGLAVGVACAIDALRPGGQGRRCAGGRLRALPGVGAEAGGPVDGRRRPTLADGIAVKRPSGITVDLIRRHVDEIVAVGENEIADAIGDAAHAIQARRRGCGRRRCSRVDGRSGHAACRRARRSWCSLAATSTPDCCRR